MGGAAFMADVIKYELEIADRSGERHGGVARVNTALIAQNLRHLTTGRQRSEHQKQATKQKTPERNRWVAREFSDHFGVVACRGVVGVHALGFHSKFQLLCW